MEHFKMTVQTTVIQGNKFSIHANVTESLLLNVESKNKSFSYNKIIQLLSLFSVYLQF